MRRFVASRENAFSRFFAVFKFSLFKCIMSGRALIPGTQLDETHLLKKMRALIGAVTAKFAFFASKLALRSADSARRCGC